MKGTPLLYSSLLFHLSNESDDKWEEETEGTGGWDTMAMREAVIAPRARPFTSKAAGSRGFLRLRRSHSCNCMIVKQAIGKLRDAD